MPQYQKQEQKIEPQPAQKFQHQQIAQDQPQRRRKAVRKSRAVVTRVLADLMVFVKVEDGKDEVGLVFKPNKIDGYRGEPLDELGIVYDATIPEITWDADTLKVTSVTLARSGGDEPPRFAAG
jgi:hypothetical protein